jgi:hypothetical protein
MKLPLVPAIAWLILFTLAMVMALTFTNIANTSNGGSTFLVGLIIVLYCISALLLFLKFVALGHNIIGIGSKWAGSQMPIESQNRLTTFDTAGTITVIIALGALIGCFLSFCVFGLASPNSLVSRSMNAQCCLINICYRYAVVQAGFGFLASYVAIIPSMNVAHIERIKRA